MVELNDDILLRIFTINASDLHGSTSMKRSNTTRYCSQVSQNWRKLLLDSPIIWGRVVVLRDSIGVRWLAEVMQRAGTSPLWVNACVRGVDSKIVSLEELVQAEGGTGRNHAIALCLLFHPEHAT